jgi:hypothetical protein
MRCAPALHNRRLGEDMIWWAISIFVVSCTGVLLFCAMAVSKKADRNQRHAMRDLIPFEDVTITRF